MPSLANLMEDYRNWRGRQDWEQGKGWQDFFGGDPRAQEQFEKLSGFGTDAGGLVGMIKASHGSPHLFDKFDFSRIGSGEGNQSYGHGGYFAQGFDSPVARQYREALSGGAKKAVNASFSEDPELWVAGQLHSGIKPSDIAEGLDILGYEGNPSELIKLAESRLKDELSSGHLYNVELKWPDAAREAADPLGEHHLLDWDAPLSEQPKGIQSELKKAGRSYGSWDSSATGNDLYQDLIGEFDDSQKAASDYLKTLGIPGIRYLDQGSRVSSGGDLVDVFKGPQGWHSKVKVTNRAGAGFSAPTDSFTTSMPFKTEQEARDWAASKIGGGTRNYVMFDDQFPDIVSRNGVSLSDLLKSETPQSKLDALIQNLESKGLNVDAFYNPKSNQVSLSRLVVPKESRGQGIGTQAMQDLVNFADEQKALMSLSPSTDFGATSVNRLKDFYSRFGFVPNKGKYKDFSISESMYRPKK